ncbi:N-acetyltransferase ESCO2 isoform X3 [Cynoglossus semilaevis]|uniref:N-acetyltransferase ESCO2 isoform X3 n=1 Tax=Cynoglossus semilaevis TaxID=244447 RepID=UPI0007DCB22E|nr:N-acetyltransferase ESCO2 isoform X3 [Cynoglossus semilaevis]
MRRKHNRWDLLGKMMPTVSTRKRKLSSLDHDSHPAKKGVRAETTPVKRRSPRKHHQSPRKDPRGHLDKENCPSPRKSPRRLADSPSKSLRNSPFKQKVVSSCFYGKQKTIYLTPLERKAIKDSLPSPPPPPPPALPSPPSQSKKQQRKTKKTKATGTIKRKASVGSKKPVETGIKSYVTSTKRIKLSKLNSSDTGKPATTTTPAAAAAAAPTWFPKAMDTKKAITVTFSSMKPRPKIFVGAAFFATGKKPRSIYKKSAPKACSRPAPASGKSQATAPPPTKSEKAVQQQPALEMNQKQKRDEKPSVQSVRTEENGSSTKKRTKFNPQEWMDLFDDEPPTVEPLSSPKEKHVITKKLRVVLTRCPLPTGSSSINSQESQTEGGSDPVFDLSDISPTSSGSNTSQTSAAMYPIFGSASKRSKKASPQAQVCCSTPNGPIMSMQTPSAAKERSVRRKKDKQDHNQLIIDAGQKQFGAVTCSSCGMVYSIDNPEDTFQHTQFHQRFVDSIKFVGWKKERVVSEFWDGKILLVLPDDPKYAVKKAEEVRQVADSELGFQQVTLSSPSQAKTYLFVNTDRMVVGCLVAEHIRQAYRVLEQQDQHKDMSKEDFMERHRAWCCSTSPEPALCGISRIWVFSLARRQSIATRMLDTVRSTFIFGSHLSKTEIAFSDPTPDGKLFASNYCNTPTFLVYNFIS